MTAETQVLAEKKIASDVQISAVSKGVLARLRQLDKLPTFSRALQALEQLYAAPNPPGLEQIAQVVSLDPRLAAGLMGVANTAKYASYQKVLSLTDALKRIGLNETRQLAHAIQLQSIMSASSSQEGFHREVFMQHAMVSAFICAELAEAKKCERNVSFLMGLMHDIGHYLLFQENAKAFQKSVQWMQKKAVPCIEAEHKMFQTTHAAVGARLLQQWQFPLEAIMGVAGHARPDSMQAAYRDYALIAQGGELLTVGLGFGYPWQVGEEVSEAERQRADEGLLTLSATIQLPLDDMREMAQKGFAKAQATGLL